MRQLLLDLSAQQPPTFDTFVTGQNAELLQRLQDIAAAHAQPPLNDRFIYLWGETGAGKTHLLHSLAQKIPTGSRLIPADADDSAFDYDPAVQCYLLDDCEQLPPASQIAAFALFNQIRELGGYLVSAGAQPPAQLQVREDLRTRLGWGLIYQVHGLTDDEKIAALTQSAQARGMTVSPAILSYLLTHYRRDMPSLSRMLDALDRYSLETKRPITLPLLRDLLQQEAENETP
ncbi:MULTISPECIES: DnaA regulatory inactivator Hda [unclassified Herbaspirillum]|jgi:DnaA family protein|uniref:DnaA regulatory inactivator Hda n=1 Tax=unclassified Herbaspirillum TaxID=2624150 RepID=UPI000E2E6E82|nr:MULTISPECIES: DnaA regulatory inactivator Hda [unclassified Herbaspirillum]RFB70708.1 DnaA regulatory inactivator Hda [Herbaspirillum sp. 3R-3a1]TFI08771.1 DnaA regulatory inactivator Hda [Herbaspirillum sp. 3R11]TFI15186.1 DnaA regulatory inactivator Hda [Herbaspirillum sp. 3R-11]TFI24943.1 DnaA regulatory inactivator Hda [Herbaspirillum sp. 3C11]